MKLIHKVTGQTIAEGTVLLDGSTVIYCPQPHKPSSEGKMQVTYSHGETSSLLYCSCFDCEWVDREDREERPKRCDICDRTLNDPVHCGTCGAFDHPFTHDGYTTLGHGGGDKVPEQPASPASCLAIPSPSPVRTVDQTTIEQIAVMQKKLAEQQDIIDRIDLITKDLINGSEDDHVEALAKRVHSIIHR